MTSLRDIQYQYYDCLVNLINPIRDRIYYNYKINKDKKLYDDENNKLTEGLNLYTSIVGYCSTKHETFILFQACLTNIHNIMYRL